MSEIDLRTNIYMDFMLKDEISHSRNKTCEHILCHQSEPDIGWWKVQNFIPWKHMNISKSS